MAVHRIAVQGLLAGQETVNVFHLVSETNSAQQIADSWALNVDSAYKDMLCDDWSGVEVVVTDLEFNEQGSAAIAGNGTRVSESLPPQSAGIISWKTAKVGRKYRGRTFVPAVPELDQAAGTLTSQIQNAYGTFAGTLFTWAQTIGVGLVVYHRETRTFDYVTTWVVRPTVYTQRRRTIGRGS